MLGSHDTVSPFDPTVSDRLHAIVDEAASTPGVAGMVFDDVVAAGYERLDENQGGAQANAEFGYSLAGRLACLRQIHVDPIDLYTVRYEDERAKVHVPGFDDDRENTRHLCDAWSKLRRAAAADLGMSLVSSLPGRFRAKTNALPILVQPANSTYSTEFGTWDDLTQPSPTVHYIMQRGPDGAILMGVPVTEQMSSRLVYDRVTVYAPPSRPIERAAEEVAGSIGSEVQRKPGTNIVLDASSAPGLLPAMVKQDEKARQDKQKPAATAPSV